MGLFDQLGQKVVGALENALLPEELKAPIELGKELLARGEAEAALVQFEKAHKIQPDYNWAVALMGTARLQAGDPEKAARDLEQAVTAGLDEPDVIVSLGRAYMALNRLSEAKATFKRAATRAPKAATPLAGLGEAYAREKRYGRAVRELKKALARAREEEQPEIRGLLGDTLLRAGEVDEAVEVLAAAGAAAELPAGPRVQALVALGDAERKRKRHGRAADAYRSALLLDGEHVKALLGLGSALRGAGKLDEALEVAERALRAGRGRAQALNLAGAVLFDKQDHAAALARFREALSVAPKVPALLRSAVRASLGLGDWSEAATLAGRLRAVAPEDPFAVAAEALARISAADDGNETLAAPAERRTELEGLLRREPRMPEALMGLARLAAMERRDEDARAHAAAALRIDPERGDARKLLQNIARRDLTPLPPSGDVAALAANLHATCSARAALADLAPRVGAVREQLDRPLIVAVLGEFNAGKSTFVNALIGEPIAPMGVTPTTATINLIKYGPERGARAIYRDGSTKEVPFEELKSFFRSVGEDAAREIELVEVMYPIEELTRVNVVDTPGLNSLIDSHERVTRNYIARADAVVWLFDVGQAGKLSEARVLDLVQSHGTRTLGVLNKIDNVSEAERATVLRHVKEELGDRLVDVMPVSAKMALAARQGEDAGALADSGFSALRQTLDEQFFLPSRELVREGTRQRLQQLSRDGLRRATQEVGVYDSTSRSLHRVREQLAEATARVDTLAVTEATAIYEALDALYRDAAGEVLDFVKPRRTLWGSSSDGSAVDAEDRRYLLKLIEDQLAEIVGASERRTLVRVAEMGGEVLAALASAVVPQRETGTEGVERSPTFTSLRTRAEGLESELAAWRAQMQAGVFGRYLAFSRGWLRGGRLDDFFDEALPRTDLVADDVRQALRRTMASPLVEAGDAGIAMPLARWGLELQKELGVRIGEMRGELSAGRVVLEAGTVEPLRDILAALDRSGPAPS